MKRIINTLLFMFAAVTMMAQNSFVVADKNGNSQFVQGLIFEQQQMNDRFTWKSDGLANGDIKDLLFIARAQSELVTANSDDVTEMLEELSGTDIADAEGIAAALKSNSNVDDAYTVDGENLVFQKDESQFHTIYPMYDLKPAFSESYYLGAKQFLGKQYMKRKKAKGSSSQKVAIFNFFHGDSDYVLQNQLVEMTATLFDTNNYDVTMYENSNFTMKNLEDVINESKTNKNYKAIIIMSHGAMLTDASFSAEGLSVFMTGEECDQYDSCDKMYDSKSKKYFKTHSSAIYPDKDCILYLGSCYGAYWGEKHWKGDSNYDYSITSGIDPHEFDLPYAGLKTKGSNETSQVISYPDKDELTVVAWYGRNSIAQAHAAILFNKMIYNEQGLPDAIRSSFWIDPINWETHLFVSRSISQNHSLTLSGLQENKPDYRDNVSIRLTNVSRDMLVTNSGDLVKSPIDITGTIEGTVNGWVYCGLSRVTGDGKSGIYVNEKYPFYIYTQNSKKYFRAKFPIRFFAEGVYAFRVFDANLQEIRLQNPYYIVFSRNFSENYALPELPEEDVYTPSILDDSGQPLEEITVAKGANKTFEIDGYGGHSFWALSLDESIAKVSVNGTSLTVTGVAEGTTYIGVQDYQNKLIAVAKVIVTQGGTFLDGQIVMTRKLYVHHYGDFNYSGITFAFNNGKNLDLRYFNTDYWQDGSHSIRGIYIMSSNADENIDDYGDYHNASRHTKEWYVAPIILDEWFTEKLIIHTDGRVQYYLNDEYMGEEVFDGLNLSEASSFNLEISPWGWWTGMYTYMDDFYLSTPSVTYSDNFNDGVIDLSIWKEPINPDGVREEDGIIKMEQLRTDENFCLYIKSVPLTAGGEIPSYASCPDSHHPHLIDLGLPSGTKWACCNVGALSPEQYGFYFAWGETSPKNVYNWDTYQYGYYNDDGDYSYLVNIGSDIAGTQYDAATTNWGSPWVMPSVEQIWELKNSCTLEWTTENGFNGRKFTGPNGSSIFLPAAGFRMYDDLYSPGLNGYYWSSSHSEWDMECAYELELEIREAIWFDDYSTRDEGFSVRPVLKN